MSVTVDVDEDISGATTTDWRKRRNRVLERDNYECQHCHRTGGERGRTSLQVHRPGIVDPEPAEPVTLCRYCHAEEHHPGEEWEDWLRYARPVSDPGQP